MADSTSTPNTKSDKATREQQAVVDKIATMPEPYRGIGSALHDAILSAGPKLKPRLWYGMPGYATGRSTPVVVFFRLDDELMTFGLTEKAQVQRDPAATDALLPCAWYLNEFDEATAARVGEIVRSAFGE